ncbi:1-phosphofructokinase [Salmonella enterica]|uniref:Phosphofructokinase n=3 Tax=Salmonella enterica TaxID=28901 RepID=A0A757RSF7_SALER|nr:1-phosphofructokinase [Salmonella enterica]EAA1067214.1 1-phosphofructokinase [Salmonella enterica subsp. enterica serovar Kottbus]EAA9159255.1 1-phosphofructokinase [Salmonella enterica subsp. enterica]EDM6776123.1 1-phosphofructokinase [Salmonella enterica subsp. enterica serovar Newport]EAA1142631.1 1-phosphofructokinase [Salmonella enterica subsp. enterica serovar Kottbus]EAB8968912.1 1-phosphofructokinase [Salmonella enterica subsp. enterica serovar Kottbus]
MIYTLTLNSAIDMNIFSDPLRPNIVNRTHHTEFCPNGKGVNVALVLDHFQIPAHILGIFGGFTGHYIVESLRTRKMPVTPAWVEEPTRINIFIHDGKQEYKLVNPGSYIPDECKQQIITIISQLPDADYLVISGSLPQGIESRFYAEIMHICQQKNIGVILDISHPSLRQLLEFKPLLIKPNDEEVKAIFGLTVSDDNDAKNTLTTLHALGAQNVLLTLGAKGMYFSNGIDYWFCSAPTVDLVSSACAGDAALAAFLSQWLSTGEVEYALSLASATGADVASSAGLGQLAAIETLLSQIHVRKL